MRKNLLLSALNVALIKVNNNANINSIPCKMFIPDPSLVVNLILTNLILVLTSSQLSVMLQAVYVQRKYEIDMKCRNSSLGASFISYCRNIHEKKKILFSFLVFHVASLQASSSYLPIQSSTTTSTDR